MLNKLISIASVSLFASVAQAGWADVTSPKDVKIIEVKPCEIIAVDYTLGAPGGNGQSEQLFEAYEVPSKDFSQADNPERVWHVNEEMGNIPFVATGGEGLESKFYAFVYHSWSPTGNFWSQGALSSVKLVNLNPKTLEIKYRKGGAKNPLLSIEKTRDGNCEF